MIRETEKISSGLLPIGPLGRIGPIANQAERPPDKGFPQRLQKRAEVSFCVAPHDAHLRATLRLAPQDEQNSEPAVFAEPQLPQRPGSGGTYPPALPALCSSIIFQASSVILYCQ